MADASVPSSLSGDRVTSFAEDPLGHMWIGTDGGGLNLFDSATERFHRFRHDRDEPGTLASDTVYSIAVAPDGTVWVGTQGGGLDRVVGSADAPHDISFSNLSQRDGLTNDVVYGVLADESGRLWLSTNYGISVYDPGSGDIRSIHRRDGLQSEEFNFGAYYRSASGEMFFGGVGGFNAFYPTEVDRRGVAPIVALTGIYEMGRPVRLETPIDAGQGLAFGWGDDVVTFEFAALDFAAPSLNRYMAKLEGFDRDWIDLGTRRAVTYTDLDTGDYLLRVKAASSDGVWSEQGFAVPIHVDPAPWETAWAYAAYLGCALLLGGTLWAGHRRKLRQEEAHCRELERVVAARTEALVERNEQLRALNGQLQESSLSDPLTGLRNRRFVFEEIARDLDGIRRRLGSSREERSKSDVTEFVFMMLDLDSFKPINDAHGHAAGDRLLVELRNVLLRLCRRSDHIIRWGGDEFVVIANKTRGRDAKRLAERIRTTIAAHEFPLGEGLVGRTTCSIGFVAFPLFRVHDDDSSLDQIICLADQLMYEAKRHRNAWVGMVDANEVLTSFDSSVAAVRATEVLFRARRHDVVDLLGIEQRASAPDGASDAAG